VAYSDQFPAPASARSSSIATTLLNPALLWILVARHYRRLALIAALTFAAFATVIVLIAPLYSGTAIVLIDPRQQRVLQSDAVLSGIGNDMAAVDSQIEVIQSSPIATKVITDLQLDQDPEFVPSTNGIVSVLRSLFDAPPQNRMAYALSRFATNLKVRRRGATYILEIEFLSHSAERSAQIANAIATTYVEQQVALKSSATNAASNWLAERLTGLRKQSSDAEAAVARYREQNGLVNSGEKRSVVEQQLADINPQLVAAGIRTEEVRSRLKQIDKAASDPAAKQSLIETFSSPVIVALRAQYAQAFKSGAELAEMLGPKHPAIKTSEAEQAAISRQIDVEIGRVLLGVKNEFEAAQGREKALEANLAKLKATKAANDQSMVRLHELEQESDAAQAILQRSLARYKETREQEGVQAPEARILSPAAVPIVTNSPNRKLLLAAALIASLAIALLVTVATDQSGLPAPSAPEPKRRPSVAEPLLQSATLGYLPDVGLRRSSGRSSRYLSATPFVGDGEVDRSSFTSPFSPFNEAVSQLASDFFAVRTKRPYVIAVTGVARGDGASTVAMTLADVVVQLGGGRVLRVDATHAGQSGHWTQRRVGLSQTIDAGLPVEFAIDKAAPGAADVLNCDFEDEAHFLRLADSAAIEDNLRYLKAMYDVIVVDTGITVANTQSQRLITLSDAAILILTDTASLEQPAVVAAIKRNQHRFGGFVLNRENFDVYRETRIGGSNARSDYRREPVSSAYMVG
jgi:succinoglycan biosynthesis transport protein ExoP